MPGWPRLHHLTCSHNSFTAMDSSLTLAPALRSLCLCNNNIRAIANLHLATALTELRLSHNAITEIGGLEGCTATLQVLHLQVSTARAVAWHTECKEMRDGESAYLVCASV